MDRLVLARHSRWRVTNMFQMTRGSIFLGLTKKHKRTWDLSNGAPDFYLVRYNKPVLIATEKSP